MKWNKAFEAFTLMELAIAMLIASVVSAGVVFSIQSLNQSAGDWLRFQSDYLDEKTAISVLKKDVFDAEAVYWNNDQLLLHGEQTIEYSTGEHLVRNTADTLMRHCSDWSVSVLDSTSLVKMIFFRVGEDALPVEISKVYTYEQQELAHANSH